jgi:hypothetical protein
MALVADGLTRTREPAARAHRTGRPCLLLAGQARAAEDADGKDRGEAVVGGYSSGKPALRKASNEGFKIGLRSVRNLIESWGLTLRA